MTTDIDPNIGKEFIEHFGTKGMRWGVRRSKEERAKGDGEKKSKKAAPKEKKIVGKTKTTGKDINNLSDLQLQKLNNRLNMEQQYAKLTAPGPSRTNRILKSVGKFGTEAARSIAMTQVKALGNEAASAQIGNLMKQKAAAKTAKNMAELVKKGGAQFT